MHGRSARRRTQGMGPGRLGRWLPLLVAGSLGSCASPPTGLRLTVTYASNLSLDQLRVAPVSAASDRPAVEAQVVPATASSLESGTKVLLLLPPSWAGARAMVQVTGLLHGADSVMGQASAEILPGQILDLSLSLDHSCAGGCALPPPPGSATLPLAVGGIDEDRGKGIAVDGEGNTVVVGDFRGAAWIGPQLLTGRGGQDLFVARFSPAGELLWAKSFGGGGWDESWAVALDAVGNIYVTGAFSVTATFGATKIQTSGGAGGGDDIFVAKLDPAGEVLWAVAMGGRSVDVGSAIAVDAEGNVLLAGAIGLEADLGGVTLVPHGGSEGFVARLNPAGRVLWAVPLGGKEDDAATGVAADPTGGVWVTGYCRKEATFGAHVFSCPGNPAGFLARLSSGGEVMWVKMMGERYRGLRHRVAADAAGNALVTGHHDSNFQLGTTILSSQDGNSFLAKLSPGGDVLWATSLGAYTLEELDGGVPPGLGVTTDADGNSYVTGSFSNTATSGLTTLVSQGNDDVFLAQISSAGQVRWASSAGSKGDDVGMALAWHPQGGLLVTGLFAKEGTNQMLYSAEGTFWGATLTTHGKDDAFVVRVTVPGN